MERVTLEVYLQKVTIFVLCYCRRQPNPRNKTQSNLATNQTRDKNKNSYVVKLPETEFRLKGFGHLFSKRCEEKGFVLLLGATLRRANRVFVVRGSVSHH